jgi:hypothetical protein
MSSKVFKISTRHLTPEFAKSERAKLRALKTKTHKKKKHKSRIDLSNKDNENLNIRYKEFLKTKYWKRIAAFIKKRDKKCLRCGKTTNLHAHHKNYGHHGFEHLHLKDIITLCGGCHKAEHGL